MVLLLSLLTPGLARLCNSNLVPLFSGAGLLFRNCDFGGSQLSRSISVNTVLGAKKVPKLAEDLNGNFIDTAYIYPSSAMEILQIITFFFTVHDYGAPDPARRRLYVFGLSAHGALGMSSLVRPAKLALRKVSRPIRHEIGAYLSVSHVAAGHGFSL